MSEGERRSAFLKKYVGASTVSVSLVVSGFLLSGCGAPPIIMYTTNYVAPDTGNEVVAPEASVDLLEVEAPGAPGSEATPLS